MENQSKLRSRLSWLSLRNLLKGLLLLLVSILLADCIYLATLWPNWQELENGAIPKSRYMQDYEHTARISWQPIHSPLPRSLTRPFIIAEDSRFYEHNGYDIQAIRDALRINWQAKKWIYGASTISQQTIKNMFLSHERSLLRKWHELLLTIAMEKQLSKQRILSLYLNIAEFGPGIFGVEAASRHYFAKSFLSLEPRQAAALAATLPSPRRHNPQTKTRFFQKRRDKIIAILNLPPETAPASQLIDPMMPQDEDDELPAEEASPNIVGLPSPEDLEHVGFTLNEMTDKAEIEMTEEEDDDETEALEDEEAAHSEDAENTAKEENILEPENRDEFDPSSEYD